jgi:hypothetical protein
MGVDGGGGDGECVGDDVGERGERDDDDPDAHTEASGHQEPATTHHHTFKGALDLRSLVGSLNYIALTSRPDIAEAVRYLASHVDNPTKAMWGVGRRILAYLKGTATLGILFGGEKSKNLLGFSDASWGSCVEGRKSVSGFLFKFGGGAVSWKSVRQRAVALSTAEAEYMALSDASREATWLRWLLEDMLGQPLPGPVPIMEDNQAAIQIAENPVHHDRSKHIDIRFHFTRDKIKDQTITVAYVHTSEQQADILTKALDPAPFKAARAMLGMGALTSA